MINHLRCNIDIKNRLLLCPLKFPYFSLYLILIRLCSQQSLQIIFWRFFYRFICNVVCEQIYWEGFKLHPLFPYSVLDLNKALSSLGMHMFLRAAPEKPREHLGDTLGFPMSLLLVPSQLWKSWASPLFRAGSFASLTLVSAVCQQSETSTCFLR